jgi:hypothetical protein
MKLMKLAYFGDLMHVERYGQQISPATWNCHHFGAVCYTFPDTADWMEGVRITKVPNAQAPDRPQTIYSAGTTLPDYHDQLTVHERDTLNDMLAIYGDIGAERLGEMTKETKPWIAAGGNGPVDLSVVAPVDPLAFLRVVFDGIDRSVRGSQDEIADRDAETIEFMRPYHARALGER